MDQGFIKIFPKSSKDVNMDWKVRSTSIFKIFERYYLEFIEDREWIKDLPKSFQNLRKVLPRNSFVGGHERVREDPSVTKEFIDSRVDLPKSFQNLRKMLTLNKTRIGKFDG